MSSFFKYQRKAPEIEEVTEREKGEMKLKGSTTNGHECHECHEL